MIDMRTYICECSKEFNAEDGIFKDLTPLFPVGR